MQIFILPHIPPQKIFLHRFQHVLYTFQNSYFAYYLPFTKFIYKVEHSGAKITLFHFIATRLRIKKRRPVCVYPFCSVPLPP